MNESKNSFVSFWVYLKDLFFSQFCLLSALFFIICLYTFYGYIGDKMKISAREAEIFYKTNVVYQEELKKMGKGISKEWGKEIEKVAFQNEWKFDPNRAMWYLPTREPKGLQTKFEILENGAKYRADVIIEDQYQCVSILKSWIPNLAVIKIDKTEFPLGGWALTHEKIVDICENIDKIFVKKDQFSLVFLNKQ